MNCTRAEQLIPLHAGGDLSPTEADRLRQHIDTCARCQQIAEEFTASQAWLSQFAAPAFDESDFANLRASVQREIEQRESAGEGADRRRWFGWLWPQWSPRFAFAAAIVLLLLIGGFAVSVTRHKTPAQPETAIKDKLQKEKRVQPSPLPQRQSPVENHQANAADHSKHSSTSRPVQRPQRLIPEEPATNIDLVPTAVTAQVTPDIEPTTESAHTADVAKAEPEMLRIEFQTADPNIRIIWFAPKSNKTEPNTK
ncbi:MAG: zf-HC2 domain-containing protein [Acidobacteriota bacterium]|nr:zf-HC2 domain-containing protein [Acidobacteriota bacterium]